jgi:hypothetical protein
MGPGRRFCALRPRAPPSALVVPQPVSLSLSSWAPFPLMCKSPNRYTSVLSQKATLATKKKSFFHAGASPGARASAS